MGELTEHAKRELELAGCFDKEADHFGGLTGVRVMELIEMFEIQDNGPTFGGVVIELFQRLGRRHPIKPLTGIDEEWRDLGDGTSANIRCDRVYRDNETGEAYDIEGRVFREPDGSTFTSAEGHTVVAFPYTPATKIVDVDKDDRERGYV